MVHRALESVLWDVNSALVCEYLSIVGVALSLDAQAGGRAEARVAIVELEYWVALL